jgi:uncharacterized repeat protein (TIGR02543 family)
VKAAFKTTYLFRFYLGVGLALLTLVSGVLGSAPIPVRAADANLRGYWALDGNTNDSSGYGYNGTLTGGSWSASHAPTSFANSGSLSLDGSSGQGVNTAAVVTTAANNVSLSAWVKWAGANGSYQAILYNGNSGTNGYGVFVDATGALTILNGGIGFAASTFSPTPGVWQYVVALREAGTWKLYVDGNQIALTGNPAPNPPASVTSIGRVGATTNNTFNGLIDEARVYDRVLTSAETCSPVITVTNANNTGAGSLRNAIAGLCSGGTITFSGDYTVTLASELAISKNMTIDGAGHNVTVSGNHVTRVMNLTGGTINLNQLTIANGYFDAGYSGESGAGIYVNGATLNVSNSTFSGNTTGWPGGGGIQLWVGTANVTNSTFIGNSGNYGGGIDSFRDTTLNVTNSTFSGNSATQAGGAISVGGVGNIINSTMSGNSAGWADPKGGGGINNEAGSVVVMNSILANNTNGNCFNHYSEYSFVGVNSLVDDSSCSAYGVSGFTNSSSILLGTFGNYGGNTQTFPLLPGSSAIDAGDDATCAAAPVNNLDQRGIARPQGAHCDMGAFESRGFTLSINAGDNQHTRINTAFTNSLVVGITNAFGEPVNGGKITFTPPASGASASISGSPATIASGAASVNATANGVAGGPYLVNASAAGANSVDFSLTNDALVNHTVTFNANLGSGSMSPQTANVATALTTNAFTRTGYSFSGWNTASNGSGTAYANGATYNFLADITLYAQWTGNTYTITFNSNGGGTPSPASKQVTYGNIYGPMASVSRTGYGLIGWFDDPNGGNLINPSQTVNVASNQTLYAHWSANTYTITFDANGGDTPSLTSKQVTYDQIYGGLASVSRTGYTLNGWYTASTGGSLITPVTTVYIASDHTLYAQWLDIVAPSVGMTSTASNPTNASPIHVSVTFSEVITGFLASDIVPGNATVSNFSGSGANYSFDLTPASDGLVTADIAAGVAADAAGNGNTAAVQFVRTSDRTAPMGVSVTRLDANPTSLAGVRFLVRFSEAVSGVDATSPFGDFSLVASGLSGAAVTGVSGSGAAYTVTVSTGSGNGTLRLNVTDDNTILDAVGNPLGGVGAGNGNFTTGESYTVQRNLLPGITPSANPVNEGTPVIFTGSFSYPMLAPQAGEAVSWNFGDGSSAVGVLSPTHTYGQSGLFTVTLTVTDTNGIVGVSSLLLTVNNVAPTVDAGSGGTRLTGIPFAFHGSYSDPGWMETHTIAWSFGDGSLSFGSLTPSHSYAASGTYTATLTITDSKGGVGVDTTVVNVMNQMVVIDPGDDPGDEWSDPITTTTPCGTSFIGEFGNQSVTVTLQSLPAHSLVTVSFDLFIIRSWDGNQVNDLSFLNASPYSPDSIVGPDIWQFQAGGNTLLHTSFSNNVTFSQAYPGSYPGGSYPAQTGASVVNSLCYTYGPYNMSAVYPMRYTFAHTGDTLVLDFSAMGLQVISDESWGLDNVKVSVSNGEGTPYLVYLPIIVR